MDPLREEEQNNLEPLLAKKPSHHFSSKGSTNLNLWVGGGAGGSKCRPLSRVREIYVLPVIQFNQNVLAYKLIIHHDVI